MDRFLFRAYDKVHRDVKDVAAIDWIEEVVLLWNRSGSVSVTVERDFDQVELMQYTGLKDKNGIKIFDGDIVQLNLPNESRIFLVEIKTVRRFILPYLGFEGDETLVDITGVTFTWGDYYLYPNVSSGIPDNERMRKIGNKWYNPEFLEVD